MSTIRLKSHRAIALTAWLYCWLMGCSVDPAPESAVDHVEVDWGNVFGTLQTVWIHDDHEAWVAGEGVIWGSTDGGETWRVLWSDDEQRVYSLYGSITGDDLWAVGRAGLMLRSDNCGEDWVIQRFVTSEDLTSITGTADGSTLWAVGTSGTFLKSIDAGESWSVDEIGNSATLLSVVVTSDGSRLWAVGQYGMIWHSADAGETWDQQAGFLPMSFPGSDGGDTLNSVFVGVDGARVWAVGASGTILT